MLKKSKINYVFATKCAKLQFLVKFNGWYWKLFTAVNISTFVTLCSDTLDPRLWPNTGNPYWRRRLSTIDLLVPN